MTRGERKQTERRMESVLRGFFGEAFRSVDFCYFRGRGGMLVTYVDFRPEQEVRPKVQELAGEGWNVVVKREYSDLTIMLAMLRLYKENRIAIVDDAGGELRAFNVRVYVNSLMDGY